jgi:glycosyltransferase involved in cell wall biosynthesis
MGANGRKYVDANYTWEKITDRFIDIVERVCN